MPYKNLQKRREYNQRPDIRLKKNTYLREWNAARPQYTAARMAKDYRIYLRALWHYARGRKWECTITLADVEALWINQDSGKCALTGTQMTHDRFPEHHDTNASLDRIDNKVGYVRENVRLIRRRLNAMRSDLDDTTFKQWCARVVKCGEICHDNT